MLTYTYSECGVLELKEKDKPKIIDSKDAIVRVTMSSICTSDLHIKHGLIKKAALGLTVGHEAVGVVDAVGDDVKNIKIGDRVAINVETFCGECFFCKKGFVNNCTDKNGGWALGCRIDGTQAEYVRVPFSDNCLYKIPDSVSDEAALFVGDILATGFWASKISEINENDTALIIGAGPVGICTLLCVMLKNPKKIIVCEKNEARKNFVKKHYPNVIVADSKECTDVVKRECENGGADVVFDVAGSEESFQLAWTNARANATVVIAALYEKPMTLPLPSMYGKNLTFKTGGVDACDCPLILSLIEQGKIDTTPLISHKYFLEDIDEAYKIFENKSDNVMKVAIVNKNSI